jgi:hypothetical protein
MDSLAFYRKYQKNQPKWFSYVDLTDEELSLKILKEDLVPWIQLDINVDVSSWLHESKIAEPYYVSHRDIEYGEGTHENWQSCVLHGIDTDKTNVWQVYGYDTEPKYQWTELGEKTKNIKAFWEEQFPAESFARIRFMKLGAKGNISPHNDGRNLINLNEILTYPIPINVAIDHPTDCFMTFKDYGVVPFYNGSFFMLNILNDHSVINFSNQERIHLIAHCYIGNRKQDFFNLLARSYKKQYDKIQSKI